MKFAVLYKKNGKNTLWITEDAGKAVRFFVELRKKRIEREMIYGVDEILIERQKLDNE